MTVDARYEATLEVTTLRVVLGLRPAGGEIGEAFSLNLGESKAVELSLTDFILSGNQTAEFEVSIAGGGLTLSGGMTRVQVSLDADNVTAGVTVSASDSAVSIGELRVRALSGVELSGEVQAATLPILVLQEASLRFDPDLVEIQRGRSTEFEVVIKPSLVADRKATVTLAISDQGFVQGFAFGAGRTQHEVIVFDAGKSRETVTVSATAAPGSMALVSVKVDVTSGVALAPSPSLSLQATTPQVAVVLSPADELRLLSGGEVPVELRLDGYSPVENQEIVLEVSVDDGELAVSSSRVTLTETMQSATVRVSATRRAESGNLVVSALSGAELIGGPQSLPVVVSPRELTVSFEPRAVRLVRGVAAAETASTEVSLSVAPGLEGDERLVLELTSGVAGNLEVSPPEATLSSMARTVLVTVTAAPGAVSTEVVLLEKSGTSIGNAEISFMPLAVEVVRGVELSLSDHAGQAVETLAIVAGESTEITVATSPSLVGNERVTATLSAADGLALVGGNELILTATDSSIQVQLSASIPDLNLPSGLSASGEGENVVVVGEAPSLRVVTEFSGEVVVVLPALPVEVQQGSSATLRVETDPPLGEGQAVTLRLTMEPADAGLSFAGGSSVTEVRLGETRQRAVVDVFASTDAVIGSSARVTASTVNVSEGLGVTVGARSEATLEVTTPRVVLGLRPAGGEIGEALSLNLGESKAVELSLVDPADFSLSGDQTAVFEVSVSGDGLSLQGGTPNPQVLEVSLDADNVTAKVTVSASDSAVSVGELRVRALSGVELSGEVQAATLPIEVLQSVSLVFDPDLVLIQRGRSTEFEVAITPSLVADRRTTVTLVISDQGFGQGFAFGTGRTTRHEIVFDADRSRETVTVSATAASDSTASVSVEVTASSGVALATPSSLRLQATTPQVMVRFDSPSGLSLTEHSTESVTLGLQADGHAYRPVPDQEVVLLVEVKEGDLSVSTDPSAELTEGYPAVEISLSESSPTATVIINAGAPGTGVLEVSSDDVELVGDTELPITVRPLSSGTTLRIRVFLEGALE